MTSHKRANIDVYQAVTDKIVAALEAGTVPWRKTWKSSASTDLPVNGKSKKQYRGVNTLVLWLEQATAGHVSNKWLTFKQAKELGGSVRKGQKSTMITFWKSLKIKDDDGNTKVIPMLRHYRVFNVVQCDGLPERFDTTSDTDPDREHNPVAEAEALVDGYEDRPTIDHKGSQPLYRPSTDTVEIPPAEKFTGGDEYYSTLFHELVHSTGHKSRLARPEIVDTNKFGSEPYGREELVAEIGAAFLCGLCGINQTIDSSAAYLQSWLAIIKADKKIVTQAAGLAQRAVDHVTGTSFNNDSEVSDGDNNNATTDTSGSGSGERQDSERPTVAVG